jgi:hypothetical protein
MGIYFSVAEKRLSVVPPVFVFLSTSVRSDWFLLQVFCFTWHYNPCTAHYCV